MAVSGESGLLQELSLGERLFYLRMRAQGMSRKKAADAMYRQHPEAHRYADEQQFRAYEHSKQATEEAKGRVAQESFGDKGMRLLSLCEMATRYLRLFYEAADDDTTSLVRLGEQARYCFTDIGKLADALPQEQIQAPLDALHAALVMAMAKEGAAKHLPNDWAFPGRPSVDHSRPEN